MKKKKFAYVTAISLLAIGVVFSLTSKASAICIPYDGNIFSELSYVELKANYGVLANYIDSDSWPDHVDLDIEADPEEENYAPFPTDAFSASPYAIIKWQNTSYIFLDGVPHSWEDLAECGIHGISAYNVPEPGTMIALGSILLSLVAITRHRFKRSIK